MATQKNTRENINKQTGEVTAIVPTNGTVPAEIERAVNSNGNYISAFTQPQKNMIMNIPGHPRRYRADCKSGQFKISDADMRGNKMQMEILKYRKFHAALFSYDAQDWLEVLFIDQSNVVSSVLFKTESLDSFINALFDITSQNLSLGSVVVTAEMMKRSSKDNQYYSAFFGFTKNVPIRIDEIRSFVESNEVYCTTFDV